MEITEKWLGEIGGWAALKSARSLVAAGAVTEASREGERVMGFVGSGKNRLRAGLRLRSATDVENLCTCLVARREGRVCEHALAVALATLIKPQPPVSKKSGSQPTGNKHPATGGQVAATIKPTTPKGRFTVFLPPDWLSGSAKRQVPVFLRFEPGGEEVELALASWLSEQGLDCQTVPLALERKDLPGLLEALGDHPRVYACKPVPEPPSQAQLRVAKEPIRLPIKCSEISEQEFVFEWIDDKSLFRISHPVGISQASLESWWYDSQSKTAFRIAGEPGWLTRLLDEMIAHGRSTPQSSLWLARHLAELEIHCDLEWKGDSADQIQIAPVPCRFHLKIEGSTQAVELDLEASHSSQRWQVGSNTLFPLQDESNKRLFYSQNSAAEQVASRHLEHAGFENTSGNHWLMTGAENVMRFFGSSLPRLSQLFEIEEGDRWRTSTRGWQRVEPRIKPANPSKNDLELKRDNDWLSLKISYESNSGIRISRVDVMQMLRTGRRGTQQKDGRHLILNSDACEDFEESLRDVDVQLTTEGARVHPGHISYFLGDTAEAIPKRTESELHQAIGPLASLLRPYQLAGVQWLDQRSRSGRGALLADDMGLGKTIQTIATITLLIKELQKTETPQPTLVICPKTLISNWQDEIQRFSPNLKVLAAIGSGRQKGPGLLHQFDVILTTYQLVCRDLEVYQKTNFATIALDEASYIRNPDTEAAKAIRKLNSRARIALTGTPVENGVRDLWSIFQFLQPGYLGPKDIFRERFELPLSDPTSEAGQKAARRLRKLIRPHVLRRTKAEVLTELPEKIEQTLWCELTPMQSEVYRQVLEEGREEIRQARRRSGSNGARMTMLTVLLRLRQICCDLRLTGLQQATEESGKIQAWLEKLDEAQANGDKVLVFSQFVKFLQLMRSVLEEQKSAFAYLDGQTQDRAAPVKRFQTDPACRVFLISLKAGGYGLNLTAASHVMLMDPWWNPAVESQAIDRAHRMGQNRAVTATRFAVRGTVEEKILQLQSRKRGLVDATLGDGEAALSGLTDDDLAGLLEV